MLATHLLSACGIVYRDSSVLLVQVNYGRNKGQWMLPGGFVDQGESLEQAVVREVAEETGLLTAPKRIVGLRNGVRRVVDRQDNVEKDETSVYVAFEMTYLSGVLQAQDDQEICGVAYAPIAEALARPDVIELTKVFLTSAIESSAGLSPYRRPIQTRTDYQSYDVYVCGDAYKD